MSKPLQKLITFKEIKKICVNVIVIDSEGDNQCCGHKDNKLPFQQFSDLVKCHPINCPIWKSLKTPKVIKIKN